MDDDVSVNEGRDEEGGYIDVVAAVVEERVVDEGGNELSGAFEDGGEAEEG